MSRVHEDHNGVLWIGTVGDGLLKFDRERKNFIRYTTGPESGISGQVWALLKIRKEIFGSGGRVRGQPFSGGAAPVCELPARTAQSK